MASVTALAALGWSMTWLLMVPVLPAFRRVVDSRLASQYSTDFHYQGQDLLDRYPSLKPELREITALREKSREMLLRRFGKEDPFAKDNLTKLDRLAVNYLDVLEQLADFDGYLRSVSPDKLAEEISAAREELEFSGPELRDIRQRQLGLLEQRRERHDQAQQRVQLLKAEAASIETTLKLLADQAMSSTSSRHVWDEIDGVLDNIRESELLSRDMAVFDEFERRTERAGGSGRQRT